MQRSQDWLSQLQRQPNIQPEPLIRYKRFDWQSERSHAGSDVVMIITETKSTKRQLQPYIDSNNEHCNHSLHSSHNHHVSYKENDDESSLIVKAVHSARNTTFISAEELSST